MTVDVSPRSAPASTDRWPHVRLDPEGGLWIDETTVKVVEVALAHRAWGWSPDLIHENLPHLSLAQIYAALAYYFDHQDALDQQIEADLERVESMAARHPQPVSRRVLRQRMQTP